MSMGQDDVAAAEGPLSELKPHETLWHKDGNVILATDVFLYRVHKGVLANYSSVFKGLFEQSDDVELIMDSVSESWNGVPVVKMVDDKDEDVYNFLKTLYDRKCVA